jgi:Skp family chaperone for outer membrane proteins
MEPYITILNTYEEYVRHGWFRNKIEKKVIVQEINIFISQISHWLDYAVVLHTGKWLYCDHTKDEITELIEDALKNKKENKKCKKN